MIDVEGTANAQGDYQHRCGAAPSPRKDAEDPVTPQPTRGCVMTGRSLISQTVRAALICAATFLCGDALANDMGTPQQPVITHPRGLPTTTIVTHPHGVPTTTTYSSGDGGRAVVIGRPVNVRHEPTAAQLRQRTWEYFINGPPPPPDRVPVQGGTWWLYQVGHYWGPN